MRISDWSSDVCSSDLADAAQITPGLPVTGTLSPGSETEAYRFAGEAGERYYFDRQELAGVSAYWRLIAPNGRELFTRDLNDVEGFVLPEDGVYTLLLEGYVYDAAAVGTFGFNEIGRAHVRIHVTNAHLV